MNDYNVRVGISQLTRSELDDYFEDVPTSSGVEGRFDYWTVEAYSLDDAVNIVDAALGERWAHLRAEVIESGGVEVRYLRNHRAVR